MEKKFTRAMLCEEFGGKCRECPLSCYNNFKSLPCRLLDESDIQDIMKDYPYVDVKIRMIFNDIETRLAAVENKVENNVSVEFKPERVIFGCSYNRDLNGFSADVVDKKLYDKLEAKHEADCRLISEYDLEIKKLEKRNAEQNDSICDLYSNLYTEQKERIRCEAVIEDKKRQLAESEFHVKKLKEDEERLRDKYKRMEAVLKKKYDEIDTLNKQIDSFGLTCRLYKEETEDLKSDIESWKKSYNELEYMYEKKDAECNGLEDKYRRHNAELKSRLFDLKNVENERDHYKGLYSTKCDDYDRLLEKQIKTEKEAGLNYKNLFHSLNHKHQNVVGEMKIWKERAIEAEKKLKETEEKYNDACVLNKMREDVFEANIKLQKTIEAKDREIGLLRAELDKYKTDDECDDRWID